MKLLFCLLILSIGLALPKDLTAAINPLEFQRVTSEQLELKELSRVQFSGEDRGRLWGSSKWTQVLIQAEVVHPQRSAEGLKAGDVIAIFYRIDHTATRSRARDYNRQMRGMPGPQFLHPPQPPQAKEPDETFWAHLNPMERSGRNAGLGEMESLSIQGRLFVPGAYQYSFQPSFVEAQQSTDND